MHFAQLSVVRHRGHARLNNSNWSPRCCVPTCITRLVFLIVGDELLSFVNRQRQRLFAIDGLPASSAADRDFGVPMIGRADRDGFDFLAVQQLAIVFVHVGLVEVLFLCPLGMRAVHVADGHDVAEFGGAGRVSPVPCPPRPMAPTRGRSFFDSGVAWRAVAQ